MSESKHLHHHIDYIEIPVTDMSRAKTFYAEAFGWSFTDYGPEYAGIQGADGKEMGGICPGEPSGKGALIILYSDDLEASLQTALDAGARITREIYAFPGGRRFEFLDPCGNALAVWTPEA